MAGWLEVVERGPSAEAEYSYHTPGAGLLSTDELSIFCLPESRNARWARVLVRVWTINHRSNGVISAWQTAIQERAVSPGAGR